MKRFLLACLLLLAASPVFAQTVVSFSSPAGEYVGQGQTRSFTPTNSEMGFSTTGRAIHIRIKGNDDSYWNFDMVAPVGEMLVPREYFGAQRAYMQTGRAPALDFSGGGHGCNKISGSFAIRQIKFDSLGNLSRLEATATQYCDKNPYPLAVNVLYRASPYMFGMDSAVGHWVGQGIKKNYYNDWSLMWLTATERNMITYSVSGLNDDWTVQIATPLGQSRFVKGTFKASGGLITSVNGDVSITGGGHSCNTRSGVVTILEVIYSPAGDRIDKFYADFTHYCDSATWSGPPLKGRIRYVRGI